MVFHAMRAVRESLPYLAAKERRDTYIQKHSYWEIMRDALKASEKLPIMSRVQYLTMAILTPAFEALKVVVQLGSFLIGAAFWKEDKVSLKNRFVNWFCDIGSVLVTPFTLVLSEITAIAGIIMPTKKLRLFRRKIELVDLMEHPAVLARIVIPVQKKERAALKAIAGIRKHCQSHAFTRIQVAYHRGTRDVAALAQLIQT